MPKWDEITVTDEYKSLPPQAQAEVKTEWFKANLLPEVEKLDSLREMGADKVYDWFMQQPDDTGEGALRSAASSFARGALRPLSDVPIAVGALTGLEGIERFGKNIQGGIESSFPVNPIQEGFFTTEIPGVAGQITSMLAGGGAGALGVKALGGTAKAAQLGAKTAVGTQAFAGGTAGGAASADVLGLKGGERIARSLLGGVTELASEAIPFGMGAETGLVRNLLGESVESGAGKILTSGATEAAEEGFAETAGQATDIAFRPEQASMDLSQIGKAMLLGGAGGGLMGAINNIGRPTPPESQTPIQQALAAEINAIPTDNVPPQTEEEKRAGVEAGNPIIVDPQGNTAAVAPEMWNEAIKRQITPPVEAQAATQPSDVEARLANLMRNPGLTAAVNTADSIVKTAENTSSDVSQATTAARNIIQGVVDTPQPQEAPAELPAVTPSPAMEMPENLSQTITDFNGEIAPEMSVLPPTVQAGAGVGEAIQAPKKSSRKPSLAPQAQEMLAQAAAINAGTQQAAPSTNEFVQKMTGQQPSPQGAAGVPPIVGAMFDAAKLSVKELRDRISNVSNGPIENGKQSILFTLDGTPYRGELSGRNEELLVGFGEDQDKAIAARVLIDRNAQPITPQGTPTPATEGTVMPGGSAIERDVTKPEQMTPEERFNRPLIGVVRPKSLPLGASKKSNPPQLLRQFDKGVAWAERNDSEKVELFSFQKRNDLLKTRQRNGYFGTDKAAEDYAFWKGASAFFEAKQVSLERQSEMSLPDAQKAAQHSDDILIAFDSNEPVSSAAVDAYGIKLPEGYVKQGELYVFSPQTTTVAAPTEGDAPSQGELTLEETPKQSASRIKKAMIRFASGMSAIGDLRKGTYARAGHKNYGVGFDVGLLSKNAINELAQIILNLKTQVFIDSGAFSNFKKAIKAPVTGKKVEPLDFDQILAKYDSIISAINQANESEETDYPRPMLVMPDVIGNQTESLALIEKYKNWIALEVSNDTSIPIIPIPLGELSLSQAYNRILEILGSNTLGIKIDPRRFVVGVPSNAEAISRDDLAKFLSESKPPHIHFLGAAADQNINPLIDAVAENSPATQVTADASKIRSAILNGVAKGKTRNQAIFDALYQEDDPLVTLDAIKQSPQTTASEAQTPTPSRKGAGASGGVQPEPVEGSIPTVEQESATTAIESTEKTDVAKEAMRFLEADLTDTQRAKWTPEMFTAAQAFFDSGGKDFDSLKKAIKFPRVVQQAYLKADKEAAAEQTRREAADAAMAREVEKAEKEQAKLEADQKQREELGLKTLNSLIEKTRTNVVQGTVKSSDANQAVAILNKSGAIPNVLFTWIGTSKDFLADPANRARYPETWRAVSNNNNAEGWSENGQPIVFTNNVGVSDLDRNLAKLQGTTPEVAAVRRVILHENIHKGMFFLNRKDKMKLFEFLHRLYSPEELDQLAKSYDEYSDWRINQDSYFSIIEEAMTRDFDSMAEIPRDGIWAEFMQFLRDIWQKLTGKTSEPTLKNYKDVFRLIRNSLKNSEASNADRLKNGGDVRMSMSEFISNVTPEQDAAYAKAVADGDMETAQRMVDEAAMAAGYNVGPVPHGTTAGPFNEFRVPAYFGSGASMYAQADSEIVSWKGPRTSVKGIQASQIEDGLDSVTGPQGFDFDDLYAGKANGRFVSFGGDGIYRFDGVDEEGGFEYTLVENLTPVRDESFNIVGVEEAPPPSEFPRIIRAYLRMTNPATLGARDGSRLAKGPNGSWDQGLYDQLVAAGHDGVIADDDWGGPWNKHYIVFSPNQIKSADPVTRDDAGNVIPLSRRFQSASNDIRFSKVEYDSPNEAAFNSGAEVARNADYDERDKAVRSTIRAAYDLAPKPNGPSVPLDQLFDIAKQSMPDLTEGEFSQILQDLYEDSGALLQAGNANVTTASPTAAELQSQVRAAIDADDESLAKSLVPKDVTVIRLLDTQDLDEDGNPTEYFILSNGNPNDVIPRMAGDDDSYRITESSDEYTDRDVRSWLFDGFFEGIVPKKDFNNITIHRTTIESKGGEFVLPKITPRQFTVTTPDGQRAGSVIVMPLSGLQTRAMASIVDSPATEDYKKDVDVANSGKAKAPFGGVQFTNFMPIDRTVKSAEEYSGAAIKYVNNLEKEGVSLEDIANSVISPVFLESIGIEQDLMAQDALTIEVRQRVDDAARNEKSPSRKKQLSKLSERLSAFWQGVGSKKGQHLGQRRYLVNKARYSWMFIRELAEKAMKEARTNILISNFGSENATSFTQNSYENADMASTVSADEVAKDTINDTEWDLIKEGEQVFEGVKKTKWERIKSLVRRFAFYARAESAEKKSASKASMTDAEINELNAILTMPKAEREKAKAKDLAEFELLMNDLLGEESPTDTPTEKKKRNKRKEIIDTVEKRVKAGEPIEAPEEVGTSEDEVTKAEATAQAILKDLSERYSDPLIFRDKKPNINEMRELYKERVKQGNGTSQMTEETFVNKAIELGADEKTAGILWSAAELEIDAREAMRQDKIRQRNSAAGERADAQAHRIIFAKERLKRQSGFADIDTNPNKDTIIKAFREQVKTPIALDAFIQRLIPLKVSRQVAERLFRAAERENTDLAAMAVYDRTQGPKALKRMVSEINLMRRGEEIPLRTPIPWRELLSQKAKTVEEYRQRIFDAISANEELKSATPEQKARLADLFTEAWESNRKRILDGMQERLIREKEAKGDLSKKGAEALQEQRMRMVEDINLGIFDNDELAKRMAEKFGVKSEFTEMEREKINSLIEVLQDEGLNAVKRQVAAYKLLEVLQGELKIPVAKMLADFWVSSVLSGPNTIVSIGLAVASGAFELSTALSRVFIAGFTNPKQLPSELAGAYKTLARLLSAFGRQANIAWQYLVTGDPAFLDPSMNDVTENMQWGNIGKSNKLAEQMAKSDKILVKSAGLFMRTVSRLLTALDVFNSGLTKEGSLSIVFRQIGLDPEKIAALEKKSDLKPYKDAIIRKDFGGTPPKSARDKAIVDSYALADMMAELDKLGNVSENANFFGQQGAMTLDPSGLGGVGYRAIRSLVTNFESGSDRFLKKAQRGWSDSAQNGDQILSGLELAFAYALQFLAYNAANFGGVRFARFAGNKFNQGLSFIPGIGFAREFEAEFDPDRIRAKEAFIDSIQRNQLVGVMLSVGGYYILKAIADEPDDEKRGWFINGGWGNLTPEKKQQKLAAGEKEYTIGINGKVFNYANWPISSALAAIGSLSDLIRFSPDQWNDKNVAQIMASAAMSGAAAAADIPALSQFQEIFGNSLSSKDPNEKRMERFAKVMSSYAGGFVPRFLKDIDYAQDPNLRKYETLWEKTASHIPVYRRYEGKEYYDILGQQIQRNVYPGNREFMVKPTDPAYKVLGALNSRGIWLTPANAEHRMVGKGARRRSLTQEEADNYSLETGKGYKQMLMRYGQRALKMPTERAKAFLLDKADDVRDRALKKVYRGYTPAS